MPSSTHSAVRSIEPRAAAADADCEIVRDVIRVAERQWVLRPGSTAGRMPLAHVLRSYETVLAKHGRSPNEDSQLFRTLLKLNSMSQE